MPGALAEQDSEDLSEYQRKRRQRRQRTAEAARRYRSGQDLLTIAAELDITPRMVGRYLEDAAKLSPAIDEDALRAATDSRLDALVDRYSALLDSTDDRIRLQAAQGLRQVEADRARLHGLNLKPRDND